MRLPVVAVVCCLGLMACERAAEAPPPKAATLIAQTESQAAVQVVAPPSATEGAEAFVRALYASYADGDDARPWSGEGVWSPRMHALIRRDAELATEDLPYLDADPICNCQDWERLSVRAVTLATAHDGAVVATVRFVNAGEDKTSVLKLERGRLGWRVDDVLNPGYPSLAENIAASNARIEAGGKALDRD